jgi:hypothetical protein
MCHLNLGCGQTLCLFLSIYICFESVYNFFIFIFVAMLSIGHDLLPNYGLHIIGVFNLFEHYISLEIPIFDSCVGLERLHLFDSSFACTLAWGL